MPAAAPRWAVIVATIVALPTFALCVAASASIAWSIATDAGYRGPFLDYGVRMLALEAAWAIGIVGLAGTVVVASWRESFRARTIALALAALGCVAAVVLERQFWDDAGGFPRGTFVVPWLAWIACALLARSQRPSR